MQSSSKDYDSSKEDGNTKQKVEIDDEEFKIPQGIAHRNQKKLDADEHCKILARVLARDLVPFGQLIDTVKVRHELKPYGLSDSEWCIYLCHHVNIDRKNVTLAQVAR